MAGPIIVEGPDGQEYEFPEGTSPDVMKQAMRKRYGGAAAAPAASASPFLQRGMNMVSAAQASPATGKEAALDARNEQIKTRQDLTGKARKAIEDVQNIERKRRVNPVEREAGEAGRAQLDQGPVTVNPNVYLGPGSEFMLPPDAQRGMQAEREVYRENDVTSSVDAATIRGINSILMGVPGILNKDFRGELAAAGEDQPGAAFGGDVGGFLLPSIGTWNTARTAVNALARPFIPRGSGAVARGTRYLTPRAGEVAGTAGLNAAFQAGVQEPIRAEAAGEDLTLGGMGAAAARGLQDPLNLAPLALSGINRTWNALTSGIATPSARAAQIANQYGVGPRQTAASQGIAQTTRQLGGQVQPGDIAGFANIENMLRFALRDNPNIPDVNARIATGFERIRQSLPLEDDPTLNLARLIEREFSNDAPQTRDIIRRFLLKVGMDTPGGGQIVGDAANAIRGQQTDVLRTEVESAFGAQPRTEANAAMQASLDQFSQAYNTLLPQAPRTGPQVDRARALLAREPQTLAILDDLAQSQNLTAEQFIERNPLQALHEVQSELARQARAARASGADAGPLEITVRNMQRPLREGVPGYGELQNLWRQWAQARERMGYVRGAEAGTAGELDTVPGFGDKVLGAGGVRNSEMGTQTAADVFLQMDELSQRAAGLSVRDVISDELRKMRAAGVDQRYAAPARMAQVATEGGLDALRRVFGEAGDRVARRIEQFIDATEFARNIDPEFNSATMNKGQAMQTGAQPFAGPMGQRAQAADSALSQSALADATLLMTGAPPILSIMRAPGIAARSLQPSQRTQRNIAQTLLRRGEIGSQVPPPPGGPPPIMPIDPASVPGGGSVPPPPANALSGQPAPAPQGTPTPSTPIAAGGFAGLRTDLGAGVGGALFSGAMPMEEDATLQDRLQRAGTGFLLGYGASKGGRVGARMLGRNALAGETRTAGLSGGRRPPTQAPSLPTYKANPVKGQGFDEWLETLYSDAMRGPDNKTVLPNVFYRGMSDAEFEAAQKAGKFQSITNREGVYVEKDPTRYTGGGAYGAKRGGVIVQFDTTGLTRKTIRARTAGGFAEDGFDEIPNDKIARVWKWDPAKNDHVLVYEAGGERSLPPITPGGFAGGGSRGPKKPTVGKVKPDSPEAITNALRDMAKAKPKEPTRLERMVEEGKTAAVPPVNTMPAEADAIAAKAERLLAAGKTPLDIYDQTRVVFIPYNGKNIPIVSEKMGPEEVIRTFYSWLREPPAQRPAWVNAAIKDAPRKKGLLLTERDMVPGPPQPAPNQPLPPSGIPYGAIAGGALAGAATGIAGGASGIMAYQMLQDRNRPRNALSGQ